MRGAELLLKFSPELKYCVQIKRLEHTIKASFHVSAKANNFVSVKIFGVSCLQSAAKLPMKLRVMTCMVAVKIPDTQMAQ